MKTAQANAITQHGFHLLAIFPDSTETNPIKLCKKLRRLEFKAHYLAEQWCNGSIDEDTYTAKSDSILSDVVELLCPTGVDLVGALFVNSDPRGYALKIEDAYVKAHNLTIHRDWGGYGILAPEIGPNGN